MSGCCHDAGCGAPQVDPVWRRVLWVALVANAAMFFVEMGYGFAARSSALHADALDFLGDAANYAISLAVASMALAWRARVALLKGATLIALGAFVLILAAWRGLSGGETPQAETMGAIGVLALLVNAGIAVMLFRFRRGDANMRSVWICSRNDAIGNVAVVLAAVGVFGTGTIWPDLIVAAVMAGLGVSGGLAIVRQAMAELAEADHQTKGLQGT